MNTTLTDAKKEKKLARAGQTTLQLLQGAAALDLLNEKDFAESWDQLYQSCSWATVFQSRSFVVTWYRHYSAVYQPIIVLQRTDGRLTGLLTMARHNSRIVGAGDDAAEYQVWLAEENSGASFISAALKAVRRDFGKIPIRLKYLPPLTPLNELLTDRAWKGHCTLEEVKQPLCCLAEADVLGDLKKKDRRNKFNRLKREGEFQLELITDPAIFSSLFNELALQYDFRKSAMYNLTFHQQDPYSRPFYLALFNEGLLHFTLFTLNQKILGSAVCTQGRNGLMHFKGCFNTHSMAYPKCSPGFLHLLLLRKMLLEQGLRSFDLTPGNNGYKAELANHYELVHELTIANRQQVWLSAARASVAAFVKTRAARMGIRSKRLQQQKWRWKQWLVQCQAALRQGGWAPLRFVAGSVGAAPKLRRFDLSLPVSHAPGVLSVSCNSLADLMLFDEKGAAQSRWTFHADAMRRFELQESCYSFCQDGRLLACVWCAAPPEAVKEEAVEGITESAPLVLDGLFCQPDGLRQLPEFVHAVLTTLMETNGNRAVHLLVADRSCARHLAAAGYKEVEEKIANSSISR